MTRNETGCKKDDNKPEYLYLVGDAGPIFKVGRTTNIPDRQRKYKTLNPLSVWMADMEVSGNVYLETKAKQVLRTRYPQVEGTDEWFHGTFSVQEFMELVHSVTPTETYDDYGFSLVELATRNIFDYLGPVEGIILDAQDGGFDWLEEIKIDLRVTDDTIEFRLDNTKSALLVLLCAEPRMTLADLISHIGLTWHPNENPMYDKLNGREVREILDGPVVIPKHQPDLRCNSK